MKTSFWKLNLVLISLFYISLQSLLFGQTGFQNFIARVNSLSGNSALQSSVIDSFLVYAIPRGIPYIEGETANFIYRGTASMAAVAGDFNDWNPSASQMTRLSGTDFFYFSKKFELNARLDYKLVLNGTNWILDPRNQKQAPGGYGPNSELAMPLYVQPWEINFNPAIKHGTTEERTIHSKIVNADYQLRIYLPPDYNTKQQERLPSAYFQDGNDYIVLGSAINVIDNLLDSNKIRRLIAIFVQPNNRNEEYALSQRHLYREFFVKELVPFIDSVYRTIKSPSDRLVLGDSYGGNISTLISFMHPDVFGNLGNHSGAFQTNNYEAAGVMLSPPKRAVRQYAVWGTYEMLYQPWRVYTDSLRANGYDYKWAEYPEGHSWGLWRGTLDDILKFIFPSPATGVSDETLSEKSIGSGSYKLRQNYPNPFNNSTKISYEISAPAYVSLDIYNLMGEKVTTIYSGNKDSGVHYSDFNGKDDKGSYLPSGIYFARLNVFQGSNRSDRFYSVSNKMILLK